MVTTALVIVGVWVLLSIVAAGIFAVTARLVAARARDSAALPANQARVAADRHLDRAA